MFALLRRLRSWLPGASWVPLKFPVTGFETLGDDVKLEEESLPGYNKDAYYPMIIGEVVIDRYQVVGKLGFGASSTVWLAQDMQCRRYAALKVYTSGEDPFKGQDPDGEGYSTRAHLAELVGILGPPPRDLLERGGRVSEFFDADGHFITEVPISATSLEEREERLEGKNKKAFLAFIRRMLQWRPEDRSTARELLEDAWLTS